MYVQAFCSIVGSAVTIRGFSVPSRSALCGWFSGHQAMLRQMTYQAAFPQDGQPHSGVPQVQTQASHSRLATSVGLFISGSLTIRKGSGPG